MRLLKAFVVSWISILFKSKRGVAPFCQKGNLGKNVSKGCPIPYGNCSSEYSVSSNTLSAVLVTL
jgi:hypothetical protein